MKKLALLATASALFISGTTFAGSGGNINIDNMSAYTMHRTDVSNSHMTNWDFANSDRSEINPGDNDDVRVEFNLWFDQVSALAKYTVTCPNSNGKGTFTDTITFNAKADYPQNIDGQVTIAYSPTHCVYITSDDVDVGGNIWRQNKVTTLYVKPVSSEK